MARSGRSRSLSHLADNSELPLYVTDQQRRFVYLNAACEQWLGEHAQPLRESVVKAPGENEPSDPVSLALLPPASVWDLGIATESIHWPGGPEPRWVTFLRCGNSASAFILATVVDQPPPPSSIASQDQRTLRAAVQRLYSRSTRQEPNWSLYGESAVAQRVRRQLSITLVTHDHVALIGPRGSSLGRLAREIHSARGGETSPFASVDAPLMDVDLLELAAEPAVKHLLEHREGRATLFLEHVHELPGDAAERLRVWLEQFGDRLRCISTSPLRLDQSPSGSLPESLALLLSSIQIEIPSLRQRPADIPALAAAFLARRQAQGSKAEGLSRSVLDHLCVYPWPGDVQELDEAIRHAARSCPRGAIQMEHLPLQIRSWHPQHPGAATRTESIDLDRTLEKIEAELIRRALKLHDQNRALAARQLGISRARVLRRISELGLEPHEPTGEE